MGIITWPNGMLTTPLTQVGAVNEYVKLQARELTKQLILSHGLGLTACQIDVDLKMFCYWQGDTIKFMVDPVILESSNDTIYKMEGCLSMPKVNVRVGRSNKVKVQYLDLENVIHTEEFEGLEARVIQHETDHCNGITILDRIPKISKKLLLDKYNKKRMK